MSPELTFFAKLQELNETLARFAGAPSAIPELTSFLADPDVRREFFRNLDRADWISPLREVGYFDDPPSAISEEGAAVRYPPWPPGKYLARMAKQAPLEVAAIFGSLETDNVTIIGDTLQAALAMPVDIAALLVPMLGRAAQRGQLTTVDFTDACELCIQLAKNGELPSALTLADALFEPRRLPR